ncbi:MAG: type II toxin-antitoxin system VapB family antitoxin [Sporichthyaceae bacterium]
MTKRLVDIDDDLLAEVKAVLGTETIKETVDRAFRDAVEAKRQRQLRAIEALSKVEWPADPDAERDEMWRIDR